MTTIEEVLDEQAVKRQLDDKILSLRESLYRYGVYVPEGAIRLAETANTGPGPKERIEAAVKALDSIYTIIEEDK